MDRYYPIPDENEREKYVEKIEYLLPAENSQATSFKFHVNLATAYLFIGNYDKARHYATAALLIEPENFAAWHLLGAIYYQKGMYKEAHEAFCRAVDQWEGEEDKEHWLALGEDLIDYIAECATFVNESKEV